MSELVAPPVEVRDAWARLLLAVLRGAEDVAVLDAGLRLVSVAAGEAIAPAGRAAPAPERVARDLLAASSMLVSTPPAPSRARDAGAHADAAAAETRRASPPWERWARERLVAYRDVAAAAPRGRSIEIARRQARALFAAGLFFEVHEVLEPPWRAAGGVERQALQGVIQAAVARHHLEAGNLRGAAVLARAGADKLAGARVTWEDLPIGEVERASRRLVDWLEGGARDLPPPAPFAGG